MNRGPDPALLESGVSGEIAGYRLDGQIGRGGMAVVYLARDEHLDRQVAVKVLGPELAGDDNFRSRFLREARLAAAIGDPHIIPVYGVGAAGRNLYVAMRYVRGGDARALLNRLGPLPADLAWRIIAQVAAGLDAAHGRGLIHRDVRPANMLLDPVSSAAGRGMPGQADDSDPGHVYLSGFGLSRNSLPSGLLAAGHFAGTLDYLAPEQIDGRSIDGRADLYSLACAGFELLCGAPPFGQDQGLTVMYAQLYAPPPAATARRPDLPAAVDQVLATALAKDPEDRYPTCGQFADALRAALGLPPGDADSLRLPGTPGRTGPDAAATLATGEQEPARPESSGREPPAPGSAEPGRPYPWQSRHRAGGWLILAGAALAVVAAAIAGLFLLKGHPPGTAAASSPAATSPAASSPAASSPASSAAATPSPPSASGLAFRQAGAISTLLDSSAATRQSLQAAVSETADCTSLSSAVSQLQAIVNQRGTEYHQASALPTAALANGATVKSDLIAALRNSLNADMDYLTWAQQQADSGCTPADQSAAYAAARQADAQADTAKQAFVQVWNPVAARYRFRPKSATSF